MTTCLRTKKHLFHANKAVHRYYRWLHRPPQTHTQKQDNLHSHTYMYIHTRTIILYPLDSAAGMHTSSHMIHVLYPPR